MAADPQPLLLQGGFVFDDEARTFVPADVLCSNGTITSLGRALPGSSARVLDCTGAYLIPGLMDCHVHLMSGGEAQDISNVRAESGPIRAWRAAKHASATLRAGFTTVRDLGAAESLNIHLARGVELGLIEGPTILAAGLGITMTGGHGHGFLAREADGPDDVRKAVREQLRSGARAIKLFASGGVLTPGVDPRSPSFTQEELAAGVEEAHKAFRVTAAHAQATDGIKNAVRAGIDSIEHGVWLDDEAVEMMAERGTYLVATLTAPYHIAKGGLEAGIAPHAVEKAHQVLEDHIASFRKATAAGIRLAMGTDQGTPLSRPGENAQEILRMAEHGLSPAAALLAATAWAADLLKVEAGRLREGLAADVVVLPADPLKEVAVLTRPHEFLAIIQSGRIVRANGGAPMEAER